MAGEYFFLIENNFQICKRQRVLNKMHKKEFLIAVKRLHLAVITENKPSGLYTKSNKI